jgi:hypothetical protein
MKIMTQEQKDLLLKDLCSRLPYGVKCAYFDGMGNECEDILNAIFPNDERLLVGKCSIDYSESDILGVVPYLFPLSSMTEEQKKEYNRRKHDIQLVDELGEVVKEVGLFDSPESFEYLIENHFDYHGLIPMGLAIDATGLNIY